MSEKHGWHSDLNKQRAEQERERLRAEIEAQVRAELAAEQAAAAHRDPTEPATSSVTPTSTPTPSAATPAKPAAPEFLPDGTVRMPDGKIISQQQYKKDQKRGNIGCAVLVFIGLFGFYACMSSNSGSGSKPKPESKALAAQDPYLIREYCLSSVRKKLKAPSTAQFNDSSPPKRTSNGWLWVSHVDAQNSFGAMIRTEFICEVTGTTIDNGQISTVLGGQ